MSCLSEFGFLAPDYYQKIGQAQIAAANTSRACSWPRYILASLAKVQSGLPAAAEFDDESRCIAPIERERHGLDGCCSYRCIVSAGRSY
jgi:hypothetical protein